MASVSKNDQTADVQRIAREYLKSKLNHDMALREASPHQAVYATYAEPGFSFADDLAWVDAELKTAKTELRDRLYGHQRPLIDEIMEAHSLPPPTSVTLSQRCLQS